MEGTNTTGRKLVATKLYEGVPLPFYQPSEEDGGKSWFKIHLANCRTAPLQAPRKLQELVENDRRLGHRSRSQAWAMADGDLEVTWKGKKYTM